jgi:hypothetical protein
MIYVIGPEDSTIVKIGHTTNKPSDRLGILQIGNPVRIVVRWGGEGDRALESHLHAVFKDCRVRGEWFDLAQYGDPVQAVKDEIRKARALLAKGEILQVGDRYRDKGRLSRPEMAALSRRANTWDPEVPPEMRRGSAVYISAQGRSQSWDERFPPVRMSSVGRSANGEDPKVGCIRVWKGRCRRPAGTTCGC